VSNKYAVRNLRLCTKDCLCLYVCPTGASDTENSIIDKDKCIGCGMCSEACPSKAISMVPKKYPKQQEKTEEVVNVFRKLIRNKSTIEAMSENLSQKSEKGLNSLLEAISESSRLVAEDLFRESGYMLPQSKNAHNILKKLFDDEKYSFLDKNAIKTLLETIEINDK